MNRFIPKMGIKRLTISDVDLKSLKDAAEKLQSFGESLPRVLSSINKMAETVSRIGESAKAQRGLTQGGLAQRDRVMGSISGRFSHSGCPPITEIDSHYDVLCDDGVVRRCKVERVQVAQTVRRDEMGMYPWQRIGVDQLNRRDFPSVFVADSIRRDALNIGELPVVRREAFVCSYYNSPDDWGVFYRWLGSDDIGRFYGLGLKHWLNPPERKTLGVAWKDVK